MTKIYVRQIKVRHWFPAGDPVAAHIARLCILREDFAIEMSGIHASEIKKLDGNDVVYRKFYFWRRLVGTLDEIRGGGLRAPYFICNLAGILSPCFRRRKSNQHLGRASRLMTPASPRT